MLSDTVGMSMPTHKDVTVKLSLHSSKGLEVSPRDNLVAVDDTDLEVADGDHLCLWEAWHLVKFALDDMSLALGCCQILKPFNSL